MSDSPLYAGVATGDVPAALAALEEERRKLADFQEQLADTTTVTHSADRMLTVTFDGRAELTKLTINTGAYRRMAPAELATAIVECLAAGRAAAYEKLSGFAPGDLVPGVSFEKLSRGDVDLVSMVNALVAPALDLLPDSMLTTEERAVLQGGR